MLSWHGLGQLYLIFDVWIYAIMQVFLSITTLFSFHDHWHLYLCCVLFVQMVFVDFLSPSKQKVSQVNSPVPWVHALTNNSSAAVASACGHRRTRGPDPCQWVIALHAAETRCTIIATTHIQQPIKATGTQTAPFCAHRCDGSPFVHLWVVALCGRKVRCSVIPAC